MSETAKAVEEGGVLAPNDHRRLGQELGLFTFSDLVGSGLPLWLPKGATIRRILERFIVDTEIAWGYHHVYTPDIAKLDLYKTSDRKSTRLNSSHRSLSRMPSSA